MTSEISTWTSYISNVNFIKRSGLEHTQRSIVLFPRQFCPSERHASISCLSGFLWAPCLASWILSLHRFFFYLGLLFSKWKVCKYSKPIELPVSPTTGLMNLVIWVHVYYAVVLYIYYSWMQIITWYIITWYRIQHCSDWIRTYIRVWTHKRHPIPHPYGWAMGCLLWEIVRKLTVL